MVKGVGDYEDWIIFRMDSNLEPKQDKVVSFKIHVILSRMF